MKDFDGWSKQKKALEARPEKTFNFSEREIWWCSIGLNIGDEQDGKRELFERPVLILKKFNNRIAWVIPLTSKSKSGKYYHSITNGFETFTFILSQLRLISAKRFRKKIRKVSQDQFVIIKKMIVAILK